MKINVRTIKEFLKQPSSVKLYLLLMLMGTFCGNTWLLSYGTVILLGLLICQFCLARVSGFSKIAFVNKRYYVLPCLLLLFAVYIFVQSLFISYSAEMTRTYAIRFFIYSFLLFYIVNDDILLLEIKMMKVYCCIAALSGILMTTISGSKSGGLLGDYQALGMMMSISCVLYAVDYYTENKNWKNLIGFLLSLTCIFVSGKRTFALLAIGSVLAMFLLASERGKSVKTLRVILVGIVVMAALYNFFPAVGELINRFSSLGASGDEFVLTSGRSTMWEVALDIFNKNKLTGIGFANFAVYTGAFYTTGNIWAGKYLTHNIYYGLLAETGIIGVALMTAFMCLSFLKTMACLRSMKKADNKILIRLLSYSLMLQGWFIIYGFTGNGIYDVNEFLLYIFAVSILISCRNACIEDDLYD